MILTILYFLCFSLILIKYSVFADIRINFIKSKSTWCLEKKNVSCFAFFESKQYLEHELDSVGLGSFLIFKFFQFSSFRDRVFFVLRFYGNDSTRHVSWQILKSFFQHFKNKSAINFKTCQHLRRKETSLVSHTPMHAIPSIWLSL